MSRLDTTVTEAVAELDKINQEETYLDWDPSSYPVLKAMRQNINLYSTLWHTALDFHENYEKWYSGPVSQLDAGAIKTQVILTFSLVSHFDTVSQKITYPA